MYAPLLISSERVSFPFPVLDFRPFIPSLSDKANIPPLSLLNPCDQSILGRVALLWRLTCSRSIAVRVSSDHLFYDRRRDSRPDRLLRGRGVLKR